MVSAPLFAEERNLAEKNPEKLKAMKDLLDQREAEMSKTAIPFPKVAPNPRPRKNENE